MASRRKRALAIIGKSAIARRMYIRRAEKCYKYMRGECFTSINDLSILRWTEIHDTKDYTKLLKVPVELNDLVFYRNPLFKLLAIFPKRYSKRLKLLALIKIWQGIKDEKIKVFGWGEEVERRLRLQKQYVDAYCNMIESGDMKYLNAFERAERALKELGPMTAGPDVNIYEQAASIEAICKCPAIDLDTCSVGKFYGYVQRAKLIIESMKEHGK